jgi:hypothetical protein
MFRKISDQNNIRNKNNTINCAFSLMETIIGITIFTVFFSSLLFSFSTLINIERKVKERIYTGVKAVNEISKKYYIQKSE